VNINQAREHRSCTRHKMIIKYKLSLFLEVQISDYHLIV